MVLTLAISIGAGEQHFHSVGELLSVTNPAPECVEGAGERRGFEAVQIPSLARNDIDDAKERVVPVERRTRATNHFHALDQIDIQRKILTEERGIKNRLVQPMSVHGQEHAPAEIPQAVDSTNPQGL